MCIIYSQIKKLYINSTNIGFFSTHKYICVCSYPYPYISQIGQKHMKAKLTSGNLNTGLEILKTFYTHFISAYVTLLGCTSFFMLYLLRTVSWNRSDRNENLYFTFYVSSPLMPFSEKNIGTCKVGQNYQKVFLFLQMLISWQLITIKINVISILNHSQYI